MYSQVIEGQVKKSIENGKKIDIGELYDKAWKLCKSTLGNYIGILMLMFAFIALISIALVLILQDSFEEFFNMDGLLSLDSQIIGSIVGLLFLIVIAPLSVGFYYIAHNQNKYKESNILDVFKGYKHFYQIALAVVLTALPGIVLDYTITMVSPLLVNILKGIFSFLIMFTSSLIVFKSYHFLTAIQASIQLVLRNFGFIMLLAITLVLLNILGCIPFLLGLFVTIPFSICISYLLFDAYCLESSDTLDSELQIEDNLIEEF